MDACAADIYMFLADRHPQDIRIKYGAIQLLNDEHVCVKPGYHGYMNFRNGTHGNNVDLLMEYLGYDYVSAVMALTGEGGVDALPAQTIGNPYVPKPAQTKIMPQTVPAAGNEPAPAWGKNTPQTTPAAGIKLPAKSDGPYSCITANLVSRGIPAETIRKLIDNGLLYQDDHKNMVFVTRDNDYCEIRGTNTFADGRCKHMFDCRNYICGDNQWCISKDTCPDYKKSAYHGCRKKDPSCSWCLDLYPSAEKKRIFICEAAIDAISLYVIRSWNTLVQNEKYYSIGGVSNQKAIDRIVAEAGDCHVYLAVDNDEAGKECRMRNHLDYLLPENKDWNEDLRNEKNK